MKKNSVELKDKIATLQTRCKEIVATCKKELREMTEDEEKEFQEDKEEIAELKQELDELKEELNSKFREYEDELPEDYEEKEEEDEPKEDEERECDEEETKKRSKKIRSNKMKKTSLIKEIRNAVKNNKKSVIVNAETRAVQVQGANGVHDQVVETEIEGILEPLYANSVLTKLGARWYTGLPMGDVQIPVMTASTVGWEGEIDEASATGNTFTTVKLQPKRLSAYVDISKQLIAQDNIGVENAIRRDLVNALNDKLEATLFSDDAGTTEKPAGLFYNVTETNVDDFAGLCQFEAAVEENNVYGQMKYVLSPAAKATFRSMPKGQNSNVGLVYTDGEMDGIESYVTTNVESKKFIYGDFSNLVVGNWGGIEIVVDPYTQATKGCVRLVINAYFDFKPARTVAFNYGNVD